MTRGLRIQKLTAVPAALFALALAFSCEEISTPDKSGISGLDDYTDPVPPAWRKKNGEMLFYAETKTDKTEFMFENSIAIPGAISCERAAAANLCGCPGSADDSADDSAECAEDCLCKSITVTTASAAAAASADEHGVIFSQRPAAGESVDKRRRVKFTISAGADGKGAWTAVWYDGDAEVQETHRETGTFPALSAVNTLKIRRAFFPVGGEEKSTYTFFVNDTLVYPANAVIDPYIFLLNDTGGEAEPGCLLYYYTELKKSSPARDNPFKLTFTTQAPARYP